MAKVEAGATNDAPALLLVWDYLIDTGGKRIVAKTTATVVTVVKVATNSMANKEAFADMLGFFLLVSQRWLQGAEELVLNPSTVLRIRALRILIRPRLLKKAVRTRVFKSPSSSVDEDPVGFLSQFEKALGVCRFIEMSEDTHLLIIV